MRMRRALAMAGTAGLALATLGAGLVGPPAAASTSYTHAYRAHAGSYAQAGGVSTGTSAVQTTPEPALTSKARTGEDSVTITAKDKNGANVALRVLVTTAGTSTQVLGCSKLTVKVKAGTTVAVTPLSGRCADGRLSMPSTGKISLSYHRLVPKRKGSTSGRSASPAQRWAVLIGVQDYAGSTHSTIGARGDVDAIRRALIGSGWRSSNIKVLQDSAATQSGIRSAMAWLAARSTPQTFSFLHFSGHVCIASRGPCPSGHTYLWSYDNRFIPETEVVSRMKSVKGYQWMDIAGCQGGAFNAGYASSTRMFTGSSRSNETSYEERAWKQSVWTGIAWERGYNQGLAHPSGSIRQATMHQIASYGVRNVPTYTKNQGAGVQHPVASGGSSSWRLSAPPGG
jgi:hypothetical protein